MMIDVNIYCFQHNLHSELQANPIFQNELLTPSLEKQRHVALKRMLALRQIELLRPEQVLRNLRIPMYATSTNVILDASAYIKNSLTYGMCVNVIQTMGTGRHSDIAEKAINGEVCL